MAPSPRKTKKDGTPKKKTGPKGPHNQKQATIDLTKKHIFLPLGIKLYILDTMAKNNWIQNKTASYFTVGLQIPITHVSISTWKEDEEKLKEKIAKDPLAGKMKRGQEVQNPELEEVLAAWVLAREGNGETVTGPLIKEKAGRFAARMGLKG
jgi:hypothetical protein